MDVQKRSPLNKEPRLNNPVNQQNPTRLRSVTSEPQWVKFLLIAIAFLFVGFFLLLPLITIFKGAFEQGIGGYWAAINNSQALSAIRLTLLTAAIVVPINLVFGITAAWAIGKFEFRGKRWLVALIDLPFTVSPVISGLIFVLIFGAQGLFGAWLQANDIEIIFAIPGIVLATLFVTVPYVARELIPLMQALGNEQEEAAFTLGASGFKTFLWVTLPNIRWGLIYGIILLTTRAMGEFGAVSVVSGHIRGGTNTIPVYVHILYEDGKYVAAFTMATILVLVAFLTIFIKGLIERRFHEGELQ